MPVPLLRPSVLNPRLSRHCIFAKSSSPVYAFGQRSCRAEVLFEWSCCVGIHDKDGVVPVNPDSVFLSAERTTLSLLISSYIAKFLAIVWIRSRRSRYSRLPVRCSCLGSCRLRYSRMYPAVVSWFSSKVFDHVQVTADSFAFGKQCTRVLLRRSLLYRVTRHARHCRFTIHGHIHATSIILRVVVDILLQV